MRTIKRMLRLFTVALLSVVFAISVTACKKGNHKPSREPEPTPTPKPLPPEVEGDQSGIDWTKYWDGTTTSGGTDGFTFNQSISIGDVASTPVTGNTSSDLGEGIAVTFNTDGGTAVATQSVEENGVAVKPSNPEKSGHMFVNWYEDSELKTVYDFNTPVTAARTLYAKWTSLPSSVHNVYTYGESLAVEFSGSTTTTVEYKEKDADSWTTVEAPLIRSVSGGVRADIVGLKAGEYDVKVGSDTVSGIHVDAYDRSGYAHFNRKSTEAAYTGVGAYKDDGTLKDGALVIYVNEANKNNVKEYVYKNTANGLVKEDISAYIKPGTPTSNGKPLGGDSYWSIGYILNNRGYENNTERANYGIQKLTFTYSAVVVRLLGTITSETNYSTGAPSLHGLTYYAKGGDTNPITGVTYKKGVDVPNGGTVNDDGEMARITNAKNLTIEGIGEDAIMEGWGIHFVSNDNLHNNPGAGTSFEVRNITFKNYPEDAIGMEGTQGTKVDQATGSITGGASSDSADLISPVERCWVHHNTFLPGFCSQPAESDKADGDGSCDFKRGQFYTLSYNHFSNCHKTNLIGSSDTTQTFNVTIHHNWYETVKARQPLARRANIHYYNNYVSDATDYVTSFRGNCLVFSEANFYDGCKQVTQKKDGVGVAWNNIYYACYAENNYTELTSRTETVANSCKFIARNIDYTQFYIQPDKFYYDSAKKVSDCLLDSATGARVRVLMSAGANGSQAAANETAINQYTPSNAVSVGNGLNLDLTKASKGNSVMSNVVLSGITGVDGSTGAKGKGQLITFTLTAPAEVKVNGTAKDADHRPQIVDSYGKVWQDKFSGEVTVVLPKGTYFITSGQKDKEATILSLSFADTKASAQARVDAANAALSAIPNSITMNDDTYVKAAQTAYSALLAAEQEQIDSELYQKLGKAITAINQLKIEYVKARINYIGTVNNSSYIKINEAQAAYDKLSAAQQAQVDNYSTLTAAWTAYAQFAAQNVIDRMLDLPEVENIQKITSLELIDTAQNWFDAVSNAFESLTVDEDEGGQQAIVRAHNDGKTYARLTNGLTALTTRKAELEKAEAEKQALETFVTALETVTDVSSLTTVECNNIVALYEKLSAEKQAEYADNETYVAIKAKQEEAAKQAKKLSFTSGAEGYQNSDFTVTGSTRTDKNEKVEVGGVTYTTSLKMESKNSITFNTSSKMTLTLYFLAQSGKKIEIDGSVKEIGSDGVLTVTLEAGAHTIAKGSGGTTNTYLFLVELTPAN